MLSIEISKCKKCVTKWFNELSAKLTVDELIDEFERLGKNVEAPKCKAFESAKSKGKNRYGNIPCVDETRVKLRGAPNDYIHANWVSTPAGKYMIATQAPMETTIDDFWRMICQEKCKAIVMLCELKEQGMSICEPYWPSDKGGQLKTESGIIVTNNNVAKHPKCKCLTVTDLTITTPKKKEHKVQHIKWDNWPQNGVPDDLDTPFFLLEHLQNLKPFVVHCSAGVGRTGTIIMLRTILDHLIKISNIHPNLAAVVSEIRRQRYGAVRSVDQYLFIYRVLANYYHKAMAPHLTNEEKQQFTKPYIEEAELRKFLNKFTLRELGKELLRQYETESELTQKQKNAPAQVPMWTNYMTEWLNELNAKLKTDELFDEFERLGKNVEAQKCKAFESAKTKKKNRYSNIPCVDETRVKLRDAPNDYIHANWVSTPAGKYMIATQAPMETTIDDFWRMICQENCKAIAMLCELKARGESKCEPYWPSDKGGQLKTESGIIVTNNNVAKHPKCKCLTVTDLTITTPAKKEHKVQHIKWDNWPEFDVPNDLDMPFFLLEHLQNLKPFVVHCSAGTGRTGIIIVLQAILDNLKFNIRPNLAAVVSEIRRQRYGAVQNESQYMFIYLVLANYLKKLMAPHVTNEEKRQLMLLTKERKQKNASAQVPNCTNYMTEWLNELFAKLTADELVDEFKRLENNVEAIKCEAFKSAKSKGKNRYGNIPCVDETRVKLRDAPNDYIHANWVSTPAGKYMIATQAPMKTTIDDFWRMICQEKCEAIAMLCELNDIGNYKCEPYWPSDKGGQLKTESGIIVTNNNVAKHPKCKCLIVTDLTITTPAKKEHKVQHIKWKMWPDFGSPMDFDTPFFLLKHLQNLKPFVVHCSAGNGRTGIIIVLQAILDNLKYNFHPNLAAVVSEIRRQRDGAVQTIFQYLFIYQALAYYFYEAMLKLEQSLMELFPKPMNLKVSLF